MDDKLSKPSPPIVIGGISKAGTGINITEKSNQSKLHQNINQAIRDEKANASGDPLIVPNRIAIMADVSGSMGSFEDGKPKIEHLQDALIGFIQMCNFGDTSVSLYSFPLDVRFNLSRDKNFLNIAVQGLHAHGGTPMTETMEATLGEVSLTRGIIISDGEADNDNSAKQIAGNFKENETPIDCVHIGSSDGGEELLKEIARITGGIFIKFDNVGNFAKAFSYLTPVKRGELTSGTIGLLGTGAREIVVNK